MQLLEAFKPNSTSAPGSDGRWTEGYYPRSRECGAQLKLIDACAETDVDLIGTPASRPVSYRVEAFAIQLLLERSTTCMLPDDVPWAMQALRDANEYAISRALVTQPVFGTESWTGAAAVQEVALGLNPTPEVLSTAVAAARTLWFSTVVGRQPTFHVPDSMVPALVGAHILVPTGSGEIISVWPGTDVVIAPGYDNANPRAFFTGDIAIYLLEVQDGSPGLYSNINEDVIAVNEIALIDVPPCSIVRVGSY